MAQFEEHAEIVMCDGEHVIACNHCNLSAESRYFLAIEIPHL